MEKLTEKQIKIFIAALLNTNNFDEKFHKIANKDMSLTISKYGDFNLQVIDKSKNYRIYTIKNEEFYKFYDNI